MVKRLALFCCLWFAVFLSAEAAGIGSRHSRVAKEELIPSVLKVRKIGSTDMEILYRKDHAFLPLVTIFKYLRIPAEFSADGNSISGFYPNHDKSFSIDLLSGEMRAMDTSLTLSNDEYTFSDEELYLREDVFKSAFRLDAKYDPRKLMVIIVPPPDLSVFLAKARERARQKAFKVMELTESDHSIERNPSLFEMGKLNWTLSMRSQTRVAQRFSYNLHGGGKILYGDADFSIRGDIHNSDAATPNSGTYSFILFHSKIRENDLHGLLRYPINGDGALREVRFGDIQPDNPSARGVIGFELTNRPSARRIVFGQDQFVTPVSPGSEVEFYQQNMLKNFTSAASESLYSVTYPLSYGYNFYDLKMYNQWSELTERKFNAVIPLSILPANTFQYSIEGGKIRSYTKRYGNASASYGLTSALTLGAGTEYFQQGFARRQIYPYAKGTVRLSSSLIGQVYVSPLSVSSASLDLQLPNQDRFSMSNLVYANDPAFNLGGLLSTTSFSFFIMLPSTANALALSAIASNNIGQFSHSRNLQGELSARFTNVQLLYSYNYAQSSVNNGTYRAVLSQSLPEISVLAPANLVFRGGFAFDHLDNSLQSLHVGVDRLLFHNLFLQIGYQRNFAPSFGIVSLKLNLRLPSVQLTSSASRNFYEHETPGWVTTNTARGAVLFSSQTGDVFFSTFAQADQGAFIIRPFIDRNGNDRHDDGEEYLPATKVVAHSPRLTARSSMSPKGLFVTNIEPYQTYTAYVDPSNVFEDPTLVPRYRSIAITGEPNVLKSVDMPILVGGTIRGTVMFTGGATPIPAEGMTLILQAKSGDKFAFTKKTQVFSTGEYEFPTVPPGTYEVGIDPKDIQSLGFSVQIASKEVVIATKPDGDRIEGLNFELHR